MADKQQDKNQTRGTAPKEVFCKYSNQYVLRGRWNWFCKCVHCDVHGICSNCQIEHKVIYSERAKKYRETKCKRCIAKTNRLKELIASNNNQKTK